MKSVVSLRSDGVTGWTVKVRAGYPVEPVAALGFLCQPEDRAFTTDDAAIALALLHSPDVTLLVERDVADAIRNAASTISVTARVTEIARIEPEAPALGAADAMEPIPVTATVMKTFVTDENISVIADDTEIPVKRKRGRPPKAEGAMTAAERARRYRRKHAPTWQMRRVDLARVTVDRIERIVAETGLSVDEVVYFAVTAASAEYWEGWKMERLLREELRAQQPVQADAP